MLRASVMLNPMHFFQNSSETFPSTKFYMPNNPVLIEKLAREPWMNEHG